MALSGLKGLKWSWWFQKAKFPMYKIDLTSCLNKMANNRLLAVCPKNIRIPCFLLVIIPRRTGDGAVVWALASYQYGTGLIPRVRVLLWVEFVGSLLCKWNTHIVIGAVWVSEWVLDYRPAARAWIRNQFSRISTIDVRCTAFLFAAHFLPFFALQEQWSTSTMAFLPRVLVRSTYFFTICALCESKPAL